MSETPEQYGKQQPEVGNTVLNDLAAIHEQVRQFVERETEGWCKVVSVSSNARTRYLYLPGVQMSDHPLRDVRMTFDVDATETQQPAGMLLNFQVDAVLTSKVLSKKGPTSSLVMIMRKKMDIQ